MSMDMKATWPGWETVRLIGRGSFGAVYEIERDVFGHKEKAALKVITIPQSASDIEELYDSGYDEASVTATFKSHLESIVNEYSLMREMNGAANVVNCDDFRIVPHDDNIGWDIFIKMELLTPLTKALDKQPTDAQVIQIAKDMCGALILCKKYGIIHRDIKPQNIFVSKNGDYKLGDFGIAKTIEKTSGGTKIGTYKYMAPEVYNNQPYNLTADIYSLGLVLHWMLNERRSPFMPLPPAPAVASQEDETRAKRFNGTPIPAPAHGSEDLKRIVLKACAYDPKDRYQSAEEMLRDLDIISGPSGKNIPDIGKAIPADSTTDEDNTVNVLHQGSEPDEESTVSVLDTGKPKKLDMDEEDRTIGAFSNPNPSAPSMNAPTQPKKHKTGIVFGIMAAVIVLAVLVIIVLRPNKDNNIPADDETTDKTSVQSGGTGMDDIQTADEPQLKETITGEVLSLETIEPIFSGDASIWTEVDTDFDGYLNIYPRFNLEVAISKYPGWFGAFYLGSRQNASHADGLYTLALQGFVAEGDYQITHIKTDNSNNVVIGVADIFLHVDSSGCSISDVVSSDTGYSDSSSIIWTDYDVRVEQVGSEILLHYRSNDSTFCDYDKYPELTTDRFYCENHIDFFYNNLDDSYRFKLFEPIPTDGIVWECREYTLQDVENPFSTLTILCK